MRIKLWEKVQLGDKLMVLKIDGIKNIFIIEKK